MSRCPVTSDSHSGFGRSRLFGVLLLGLAVAGCSDLYPTCGASEPVDLKTHAGQEQAIVTGVANVTAYRRVDQNTLLYIDDTTVVLPGELEFQIYLQYEFLTQTTNFQWNSFLALLIPSAIACSPHYRTPEIISTLIGANLKSSASMGDGLEPGQSLAPFFDIQVIDDGGDVSNKLPAQPLVPLDTFGANGQVAARLRYRVSARTETVGQLRPPSEQLHQFTFSVTLNENETYFADSRVIKVLVP